MVFLMDTVEATTTREAWDPRVVGLKCFALPISVPLTKGVIRVNPELCMGCMVCVETCALGNYGVGSFELSNMRVLSMNKYDFDAYAAPCEQCIDPLCMRYCPVGAIVLDEITGARVINQDVCIGCQECTRRCPFTPARVAFNPMTMKASKCNLCDGNPKCVEACPTGALAYETNPLGIKTGYTQPEGSFHYVSC
jgi:Fe-S-cluster-containing dehydrogenase component